MDLHLTDEKAELLLAESRPQLERCEGGKHA